MSEDNDDGNNRYISGITIQFIFCLVHLLLLSLFSLMTHPPPSHRVYSLSRYLGILAEKYTWELGPANRRQKLGLVWRNRKKISQIIINDYLCLPFFLLIILCSACTLSLG
jgi:hypothetical protein